MNVSQSYTNVLVHKYDLNPPKNQTVKISNEQTLKEVKAQRRSITDFSQKLFTFFENSKDETALGFKAITDKIDGKIGQEVVKEKHYYRMRRENMIIYQQTELMSTMSEEKKHNINQIASVNVGPGKKSENVCNWLLLSPF